MVRKAYINPRPSADLPMGAPSDVVHVDFASRLQKLITEKGWNQSELARRASDHMPEGQKMGRDNVSGYIRGTTLPGPIKLAAIAKALGVQPEDILPQRGVPNAGSKTLPALDMRDLGDGNVWMRVNQAVTRAIGLKIMNLLLGEDEEPPREDARHRGGRRQMGNDNGDHDGASH